MNHAMRHNGCRPDGWSKREDNYKYSPESLRKEISEIGVRQMSMIVDSQPQDVTSVHTTVTMALPV